MSSMLTTVQEWQDEFFDLFDRVEEPVVKVTGDLAETVSEYVAQPTAWPFLAQLPSMNEIVENQIAFATRFLEVRVNFARQLVKAGQPVFEQFEVKAPRTRKARKPAVASAKAA